ncbi:MAG: hypothetical protein ACAH10_08070, partial [Methylophilaceae bacterium]
DESALGYSSALGGDVPNNAVTLPQSAPVTIPNGVRPVIVLPPESLQPHTLLVPLPGETTPPVVLRRNSIEALPGIHPAVPQSTIKNGKPAPGQPDKGKGSTIKTTPLDPIVY